MTTKKKIIVYGYMEGDDDLKDRVLSFTTILKIVIFKYKFKKDAWETSEWPLKKIRVTIEETSNEDNCNWKLTDIDNDTWTTDCGHDFNLLSGTPDENEMVFCPYCGKHIYEEAVKDDVP